MIIYDAGDMISPRGWEKQVNMLFCVLCAQVLLLEFCEINGIIDPLINVKETYIPNTVPQLLGLHFFLHSYRLGVKLIMLLRLFRWIVILVQIFWLIGPPDVGHRNV